LIKLVISFLVCIIVACIISPMIFKLLKKLKTGQNILEFVDNHIDKQGTLSMGGLIFIIPIFACFAIFYSNMMLASLVIVIMFSYAVLGFIDDFTKIKYKHNEGLKPYQKIIGQVGIAVIIAFIFYNFGLLGSEVVIPYTDIFIDIGFWIIPFVIVFFLAVTNSVNLTDGLDGLAGYNSLIIIITLGFISIIKYFEVIGSGLILNLANEYINLAIVCFGMAGALLVFLLFNCYPAKIFMGDTGSLALGGFIATVACFLQEYLLIVIIGIVFVLSSVSDILQVTYYKLRKKRIFLMAPFHHHLERKGYKETKIVGLYVFVTLVVCIVSIIIYLTKVVKI